MHIKYSWEQQTADHREINSVTLVADGVPRREELVEINVPVTKKENVNVTGRVLDVTWKHRHDGPSVEVFLGVIARR